MIEQAIILDACSLLNLYASDYFSQILTDILSKFYIVEQVKNESIYIRGMESSNNKKSTQAISLDNFIKNNLLKIAKLETPIEQMYFIDLATDLDDGEAATIARAIVHQMQIITDDHKAIRIIKQINPALKWLTSIELIKLWGEMKQIDSNCMKLLLQNIQIRANYFPHQSHPLYSWWKRITLNS